MALLQGSIERVIDVVNENSVNDFFNCIAITAMVRRGKSRLAKHIAFNTYPNFKYEENYIGNPKHAESFEKLFDSPPKSTCWIDEAEKVLSAEQRMTKEQWWLQQLFNQFASHNKTVILCTPSFRRIDNRWRDEHITIWIHIYRRGAGIVLKKRDMVASHDVWGLDAMREAEMNIKSHEMTDEKVLSVFDKNPCALFYFTFPDWNTEEEKNEYLKYKEQSQKDLREEFGKWKIAKEEKTKEKTNAPMIRRKTSIGRIVSYLNWKYDIPFRELSALAGLEESELVDDRDLFFKRVCNGDIEPNKLPEYFFNKEFLAVVRSTYVEKEKDSHLL